MSVPESVHVLIYVRIFILKVDIFIEHNKYSNKIIEFFIDLKQII